MKRVSVLYSLIILTPLVTAGATTAQPPVDVTTEPTAIPNVAKPLGGTLFFSRDQRERMDRARKRGEVLSDDTFIAPGRPSVINGFVRRSDGKMTVWVDGKSVKDPSGKEAGTLLPTDVGGGEDNLRPRILGEQDSQKADKPSLKPKKNKKAQRISANIRRR